MALFQSNDGSFRGHFERLYKQAKREGRAEASMTAAREIRVRLQQLPGKLGEPLYRLPALRLEIRHAALGPLLMFLGIHVNRPCPVAYFFSTFSADNFLRRRMWW